METDFNKTYIKNRIDVKNKSHRITCTIYITTTGFQIVDFVVC